VSVIAIAALGAVVGDNIGYLVGRRLGLPLALRHGARIGLDEPRLKVGRYLFERHGVAVVFLGRFVALLRTFAAVLAGLNAMPWPRFLAANAAGALCWAATVGGAAALLGHGVAHAGGPVRLALLAGALLAIAAGLAFFKRHEKVLLARAEAAYPGPLARS
jgi:membrane protein DedA with SNARE-associated domain